MGASGLYLCSSCACGRKSGPLPVPRGKRRLHQLKHDPLQLSVLSNYAILQIRTLPGRHSTLEKSLSEVSYRRTLSPRQWILWNPLWTQSLVKRAGAEPQFRPRGSRAARIQSNGNSASALQASQPEISAAARVAMSCGTGRSSQSRKSGSEHFRRISWDHGPVRRGPFHIV